MNRHRHRRIESRPNRHATATPLPINCRCIDGALQAGFRLSPIRALLSLGTWIQLGPAGDRYHGAKLFALVVRF
jgi:hypothetical protein